MTPVNKIAHHAFILIELVAATALAAILMLAVLGVIGSLRRGAEHLETNAVTHPWRAQVMETLAMDFQQAQRIQVKDHQLILEGFVGIDETNLVNRHTPVRVVYELHPTSNPRPRNSRPRIHPRNPQYLVRRQHHLTPDASSIQEGVKAFTTLIATDVADFEVEDQTPPPELPPPEASPPETSPPETQAAAVTQTPNRRAAIDTNENKKDPPSVERILVRIVFHDKSTPIIEQRMSTR